MPKSLHLSVADQSVARVYIQTLLLFPFPDDSQREAAVQSLERGLQQTLKDLPFFAGTVGPAHPQTGRITLTYPDEIPHAITADIFAYDILPHDDEFPHHYEQLKKDGMPQNVLTGKRFCPKTLRRRAGVPEYAEGIMQCNDGVPALAVQAFFIPGGLVLSTYFHHSVVDGSGKTEFWRQFAANVYHQTHPPPSCETFMHDPASNKTCTAVESIPDQSALRASVDARIRSVDKAPSADAYGVPNYKRTLPVGTPCESKIFSFPAERIRQFRDMLRDEDKVFTEKPMTRCNVLAALIWVHVTRARQARLQQHGYRTTKLGVAVDLRKRINEPLESTYIGNMALMTTATSPISHFSAEQRVTNATIIPAIQHINTSISRVDDTWVQRHLSYFQSLCPITNTEINLKFNTGPDLYITSWLHFGADLAWGIPGTSSPTPDFIRRTHSPSDGGIIIMPRKSGVVNGKEAPYEVLIRLATEDMERLISEEDGLIKKWAGKIVG
ncbi:hypothetical protein BU24DRAFT_343340 [Aaosphaeria arxii CBS 175.79]|uniref:Trichothecene 3-O-acetyltransferas-like protein n=1 Tax=Aaosphaeria arxii CBS 175.79 TaxID=1450172 RepID=A0A6A5XYQ4_9PLEO|nr:uncharacterized protein BU24DRAFT_343340 [Aaosphaeria arxii CBS 175.79]KAF2018106.1 hypothetical protein BU24DRAFT_343340 [Aaosphaeria arxii CBS 175.79]